MTGNCAKRVVTCTLVTAAGERIIGKNWCNNPQNNCPRTPYEDYTKCKTICQQWGHAEAVALVIAGERAMGAAAFIEGHTHACQSCQESLFSAGVKAMTIGKPPKELTGAAATIARRQQEF